MFYSARPERKKMALSGRLNNELLFNTYAYSVSLIPTQCSPYISHCTNVKNCFENRTAVYMFNSLDLSQLY